MIYNYAQKITQNIWSSFGQLWYFLLVGITVSALISVCCPEQKLVAFSKKLRKASCASIVIAVLAGVISPIPTYATLPLLTMLVKAGAPTPALFAFLVSSPLMNPALFSLTLGAFGYQMAIGRVIVALLVGITSGFATQLLICRNRPIGFIRNQGVTTGQNVGPVSFLNQFYAMLKFSGKYFLLGIVIAALIKAIVPASWIFNILGKRRGVSVIIAVAAGIPLYACGGGTIPVMQVLRDLGMDKGAILAFFISGPATKVSTLLALKATMVKGAFILYLTTVFAGAILFGFLYSIW